MIWGFSHAHLKKLGGGDRDYLAAAAQGYRFLKQQFRDTQNGGYFWSTELDGTARNRDKIIYGQSFVIYALVEFYRASGNSEALADALRLFNDLQTHAHDPERKGWIEHFEPNWTPILRREPRAMVEVGGYKSANTHLHLMEAFTELYQVSQDAKVRLALLESLRLNQKYFYPRDAAKSCFHRKLGWERVTEASSAGLSYGHNVEFAWLMIRAERVLGLKPSWSHFYAHLDHALKYGWDSERGGVYSRGAGKQPATDTDKVWWVQSEMLAALVDALEHKPDARYEQALVQLLDFIDRYQAEPKTRIWRDTVTATGAPKSPALAHNWKANYHDVRALVKFLELNAR
jgi:mannobiose 2-epimerase